VWDQLQAGGYWPQGSPLPPALAAVQQGGEGQAAAAHALGGCVSHLRDVLLDKQVWVCVAVWLFGCACAVPVLCCGCLAAAAAAAVAELWLFGCEGSYGCGCEGGSGGYLNRCQWGLGGGNVPPDCCVLKVLSGGMGAALMPRYHNPGSTHAPGPI
jgi:hypothetical protein